MHDPLNEPGIWHQKSAKLNSSSFEYNERNTHIQSSGKMLREQLAEDGVFEFSEMHDEQLHPINRTNTGQKWAARGSLLSKINDLKSKRSKMISKKYSSKGRYRNEESSRNKPLYNETAASLIGSGKNIYPQSRTYQRNEQPPLQSIPNPCIVSEFCSPYYDNQTEDLWPVCQEELPKSKRHPRNKKKSLMDAKDASRSSVRAVNTKIKKKRMQEINSWPRMGTMCKSRKSQMIKSMDSPQNRFPSLSFSYFTADFDDPYDINTKSSSKREELNSRFEEIEDVDDSFLDMRGNYQRSRNRDSNEWEFQYSDLIDFSRKRSRIEPLTTVVDLPKESHKFRLNLYSSDLRVAS